MFLFPFVSDENSCSIEKSSFAELLSNRHYGPSTECPAGTRYSLTFVRCRQNFLQTGLFVFPSLKNDNFGRTSLRDFFCAEIGETSCSSTSNQNEHNP